jgi:HK97 family phage prohead protease
MLYKNVSDSSIGGVIKDVDVKTGTVTGYFAVFGNIDSDGDMIMPGAFKRTLTNNYNRQKHLVDHIASTKNVLAGTRKGNLTLKEDSIGLYFESKVAPTSMGKDLLIQYERGDIDEHSIGYEVKKQQKASSYNELLELKLWEGSTVVWGANELAGVTGMKSIFKPDVLKKQIDEILKDIKSGSLDTEELCDTLELTFKQLEQHIIDLSASSTQPAPVAPDPQKGVKSDDLPADEILSLLHLNHSLLKKQVQNETQLYRMAVS